ncbi:MAG: hypothetical protein KGQ67_00610 [Betaproteobacteria bacterium]|nr:hypothetical protein [Betaproteobacteria bacterium]
MSRVGTVLLSLSAVLAAFAASAAVAQGLPPPLPALADLSLPTPIRIARVMDDARIDGRVASVLGLRSPWPCPQTQALVQSRWRSTWPVPLIRADVDGWLTLSAAFRDGLLSAQWRATPAGGCDGFLSRWSLAASTQPAPRAVASSPWPGAPVSARWLGRTDSGAGDRRQSTWLVRDDRPLERALPEWRRWLLQAGWRLRPDFQFDPADPSAGVLLAGERSRSAEVGLLLRPRQQATELVLIIQGDPA